MHKVQLYVVPIIVGLLCGLLIAVLWGLFWTLVIPWPTHEIFSSIVGILGGLGAVA